MTGKKSREDMKKSQAVPITEISKTDREEKQEWYYDENKVPAFE